MGLIISLKIELKLANKNPPITRREVEECFANRNGKYLEDTREKHASDPPTRWFIAETNYGRKLKIVFVPRGHNLFLRTAVDPNFDELAIYWQHGS